MRRTQRTFRSRQGSAALLAMLFLTLFTTLAVAMVSVSSMNAQSSENLAAVERARAVAESGLRWQAHRFRTMARPRTLAGNIDAAVATALWPAIKTAIRDDYATMQLAVERAAPADHGGWLVAPEIALNAARTERFQITIRQDPSDPRHLIVTSVGRVGAATRAVSMRFLIDKRIRFAVVGRVPIQIGRNTIVEGNIAMASANRFPPLLMLSDFMHFDPSLRSRIEAWNTHLRGSTMVNGVLVRNHNGFDNRVSVNNPVEFQLATARGFIDHSLDGYIDEYDLWLSQYDRDGDRAVTRAEFTNPATGRLFDESLFEAMDSIGAPLHAGDVTRVGFRDGRIDNSDGYAKVRGTISIAATEAAWAANLAPQGRTIGDMLQGTVAVVNPTDVAVRFGTPQSEFIDLNPANFEQCAAGFRDRSGANAGAPLRSGGVIANTTLTRADANGGTVVERTPFGSATHQATYSRPVFRNMTFRNVIIPRGLNALFENCTFEGVTFVETERDITSSTGTVTTSSSDGMGWARRRIAGGSFSADRPLLGAGQTPSSSQTTTQGSTRGNNLRFHNSTFRGPLAGNFATAYTHFANSWEFTGATLFDNQVDQTATIVSPQVNIEMGSFTDPGQAPSRLIGVVVAGNIDIRGFSEVDGSIIVTGDGAANTTLAYFGPADGDTNPNAMPEGGFGKLNIRYNPYRALPDGINIPVDILPVTGSFQELTTLPSN